MKRGFTIGVLIIIAFACQRNIDKDKIKAEIFTTEKAFEKMAAEKGVVQAFYYFADDSAVIHRENDTLITGKEQIKTYYAAKNLENAIVNWTPDYVAVSDCGTLGYTFGKFIWKFGNANGDTTVVKGIFHTVWKKQKDNTWKYVWD